MKLNYPLKNLLVCLILLYSSLVGGVLFSGCNRDSGCGDAERYSINNKKSFFPYQGTETIKFLYNNLDTHIFIGQGVQSYYVKEAESESGCEVEYEGVRATLRNKKTGNDLNISYERDRLRFQNVIAFNTYTFYTIQYRNQTFDNLLEFKSHKDSLVINNQVFRELYIIGRDSNSYSVFALGKGLVRIKIYNDVWDILPK